MTRGVAGAAEGGAEPSSWRPPIEDWVCRAGKDGECNWAECPQNRDGEPAKSGRHCPGKGWGDDGDY